MLHAITANHPSFRSVTFGAGLNVVLAERTKEAAPKDSRNGLGKSTLIDILHFCLGGKPQGVLEKPELRGWEFTLELDLCSRRILASRSIASPKTVAIQGDTSGWPVAPSAALDRTRSLGVSDWCRVLGSDMFGLVPADEPLPYEPSFRSLISYFIRRSSDAYTTPFEHHRKQKAVDKQVHTTFLLGLGWQYARDWQLLNDKAALLRQLRRAARVGLVGPALGSRGELEPVRVRLQAQAEAEETRLRGFRVHEHYSELQSEADALTDELHALANRNVTDQRTLALYERALAEEKGPEPQDVSQMFEEAGTSLPGTVKRRLDEVEAFHQSLLANRSSFLSSEMRRLRATIAERRKEVERKGERRAEVMAVLNTHGALDEFRALEGVHVGTRSELADVERRIADLAEWQAKTSALRIERELLQQSVRRDYDERRTQRDRAVRLFNANSEALYEAPGNLVIDTDPKAGYCFDVTIERSGSQGIESMKVFCYDLMLAQLWAGRPTTPGFLVHDSMIFDPVDERQVAKALELGEATARGHGLQYICALNSDRLPLGDFSPSFDIHSFVRLTLTDATPEGCLLGIRL